MKIAAYILTYRQNNWPETTPDASSIEYIGCIRRSLAEVVIGLENNDITVTSAQAVNSEQAFDAQHSLTGTRL